MFAAVRPGGVDTTDGDRSTVRENNRAAEPPRKEDLLLQLDDLCVSKPCDFSTRANAQRLFISIDLCSTYGCTLAFGYYLKIPTFAV